jgi:hypothetical protein
MADESYPDGRIKLTVDTGEHDLEAGIKQLNPILRDILDARDAPMPWKNPAWSDVANFGRLTFSQVG